jgi:hypothetical protein
MPDQNLYQPQNDLFTMTTDTTPTLPAANAIPICDVDIVLLDDNQVFADAFKFRFLRKKIHHFLDPGEFLTECQQYDKDTVICIDNDFGMVTPVRGVQVAEQLHALGFTRLFLVSGTYFSEDLLPDYLIFIEKINLEFFNVL